MSAKTLPAPRADVAPRPAGRHGNAPNTSRRTALGGALRTWRGRVTPLAAGVPQVGKRRVPGLRRDELAELAGLSVDYLTRLEQGRATNPSPQVLDALTVALRLDAGERQLLFTLAGAVALAPGDLPSAVPAQARRLLHRMAGTPLTLCSPAWDLLAWNDAFTALFGNPTAWPGRERNLAWRHFNGLGLRLRLDDGGRAELERTLVSVLRAAQVHYPHDLAVATLVASLCRASAPFLAAWGRFEVHPPLHHELAVVHPRVGVIAVDCDVVTVTGTDLLLVALTVEPSSDAAHQLDQLLGARPQARGLLV